MSEVIRVPQTKLKSKGGKAFASVALRQERGELPYTVLLLAINFIRDTMFRYLDLHQVKLSNKEYSRQMTQRFLR